MKVEIPEDVQAFIDEVVSKSEGCKIYIAGGYIRDLYLGMEPKDVDVFIIPQPGARAQPWTPVKGYTNYHKMAGEIPDMQDRGVHSVKGVWYSKMSTSDVQFIQYERHMSIEELAADMDMNICQIAWCPETGKLVPTVDFMDGHKEGFIECLHDYDIHRQFSRYERMEAKFPDYTTVGKPDLDHDGIELVRRQNEHPGSFIGADDSES